MSEAGEHNGEPMDDETLAAEYVLGVLPAAERASASARLESDRAFAARVAWWEQRLSSWNASYGETAPPPAIWNRIESQLFPAAVADTSRSGIWQSVAFWRVMSFASMAAAIILAVFVVTGLPQGPADIQYAAAMSAPDSDAQFVAFTDADGAVRVTRTGANAPDDRDHELWVIAGEEAPVSLGVLDREGHTITALPRRYSNPDAEPLTLAVTVEPLGGSPSGDPTGPVVAAGPLSRI